MITFKHFLLALLAGTSIATPLSVRQNDAQIDSIIAAANIPKYVPPTLNRDITDWLAIGDSFSAGISADVPADELNWSCSRFKQSYPNQMNNNQRLPGHSTSRTFVFGSCSGGKMEDVIKDQITLGNPVLADNNPKIGKPQIGTISISGNDLGFGEIVNACLYHWTGYGDCTALLKAAHAKLDDPGKAFEYEVLDVFSKVMARARSANSNFQLYITGYVEFWNAVDTQCDTVSWTTWPREKTYLTTVLREDMNSIVTKLNTVLEDAANNLNRIDGGVYYVGGWQDKYNGHRFCEHEDDPSYHEKPIDPKTWFIHYQSPYKDSSTITGFGSGSFFDQVDSILIPEKNGVSTADQLTAVNGNASAINPAYDSVDSMTAALTKLGQDDPDKYSVLPITWIRIMHPKGSGYAVMADAVIDSVLQFGASGAGTATPLPAPVTSCASSDTNNNNNKFIGRDDLNDKIKTFCVDAAKQGVQDSNSGSIFRKYNTGTRYEVDISMTWPSGVDIKTDMQDNCESRMAAIMDSCDSDKNPLNWKRGGSFGADQIQYQITPQIDQGYTPGTCSFHLQEDESWSGVDGPGTERHWTYHIEKDTMKDNAGNTIGTEGFASDGTDGSPEKAGDGNPLKWSTKIPDQLVLTPEAGGNPRDYIQFTVGSQSWTTDNQTGMPYCNVGGWSSNYSPANRNMDCFFNC
ncbi:Lipase [Lachnellula hyalina]|uniref:Lipase n=1 Tax=Lachnellula hyalina TaxID=1316788 RepID=A0A8H8R2F8_9HELO|nr:Lipase [Lachnellula hyalina]TVY27287.1 Lipase [Lachnellula hyalina]